MSIPRYPYPYVVLNDDGSIAIKYKPSALGEHELDITHNSSQINGSPFTFHVDCVSNNNDNFITVYGNGLSHGIVDEPSEFRIVTSKDGISGLAVAVNGPSRASVECIDNKDGTCDVVYYPTKPGNYSISIKYEDEDILGSPFFAKVDEKAEDSKNIENELEQVTERVLIDVEGVEPCEPGTQCEITLRIPGSNPIDINGNIQTPSCLIHDCEITSIDDELYRIRFMSNEKGIHILSIFDKDMHISGSPFEYTIGEINSSGAHKIHITGLGIFKGEVNKPIYFDMYTREAGYGKLMVEIEGPSKARIDLTDRKDGIFSVCYVCSDPGNYNVTIKFNDENIPESPFSSFVSPISDDAKLVTIHGLERKDLDINKEYQFIVNLNKAVGEIDAKLTNPLGIQKDVELKDLGDRRYELKYIAKESGSYWMNIRLNGVDIPESPFRLNIGLINSDPGRIQAKGDGLNEGETGKLSEFVLSTIDAGSGLFNIIIDGPAKVQLNYKEIQEGYLIGFIPYEPGDYYVNIRFIGVNIAGSPFKCKITGQSKTSRLSTPIPIVSLTRELTSLSFESIEKTFSTNYLKLFRQLMRSDPSKVIAKGLGLSKAFRNQLSMFRVDTTKAGDSVLMVGVFSSNSLCEQVNVKYMDNHKYYVTYCIRGAGNSGIVIVKYGDKHINGSPFHIDVI